MSWTVPFMSSRGATFAAADAGQQLHARPVPARRRRRLPDLRRHQRMQDRCCSLRRGGCGLQPPAAQKPPRPAGPSAPPTANTAAATIPPRPPSSPPRPPSSPLSLRALLEGLMLSPPPRSSSIQVVQPFVHYRPLHPPRNRVDHANGEGYSHWWRISAYNYDFLFMRTRSNWELLIPVRCRSTKAPTACQEGGHDSGCDIHRLRLRR